VVSALVNPEHRRRGRGNFLAGVAQILGDRPRHSCGGGMVAVVPGAGARCLSH